MHFTTKHMLSHFALAAVVFMAVFNGTSYAAPDDVSVTITGKKEARVKGLEAINKVYKDLGLTLYKPLYLMKDINQFEAFKKQIGSGNAASWKKDENNAAVEKPKNKFKNAHVDISAAIKIVQKYMKVDNNLKGVKIRGIREGTWGKFLVRVSNQIKPTASMTLKEYKKKLKQWRVSLTEYQLKSILSKSRKKTAADKKSSVKRPYNH